MKSTINSIIKYIKRCLCLLVRNSCSAMFPCNMLLSIITYVLFSVWNLRKLRRIHIVWAQQLMMHWNIARMLSTSIPSLLHQTVRLKGGDARSLAGV